MREGTTGILGSVERADPVNAQGAALGGRPVPIDARAPRFNQGAVAALLLVAYVYEWRWAYVVVGGVLLLSAAGGAQLGPFLRLYRHVVQPRLGPPGELEDPRPPRFAAALGTLCLGAATLALAAGVPGLADGLALLVAGLAALAAITGLCLGCRLYGWYALRR